MDKPLFMQNHNLCRQWKRNSTDLPAPSYDLVFPVDTLNRHVGVEIEVEQCGPMNYPMMMYWSIERDGSLRGDDAREFKTVFPCTCYDAMLALGEFFSLVEMRRKVKKSLFNFNERTSIHVHVDVRDLTEAQIKAATKLYMIFERSFFDLIGRERRHNIFCIPVSESNLVVAKRREKGFYRDWDKYCALNLAPINNFGTIEFRGMAGNDNQKLIEAWVLIVASLVEYAAQTPPKVIDECITTLKTESQYMQLASNTLGGSLASLLTIFPEASDSAASLTKLL